MKILNLYAGIGGNRKLWGDEHRITAVEWDGATADVYKSYFLKDDVIVGDAHDFLLKNHKSFDFIWSSPPCPSHSDIRRCGVHAGQYEALYPEMSLYQEIILLQNFTPKECKWVVENVAPYYTPLIPPSRKLHRHLYWCNFSLGNFQDSGERKHNDITGYGDVYGFNVKNTDIKDKRKALRNMVDPDLGKHILDCAVSGRELNNTEQISIFEES